MLEMLESPCMGQELDREKMRERRRALGLNQTDAATRAGFPGGASQWSDVENGRRANVTLETLAKIATALECTSQELLTPADKRSRKLRD